MSRRRPVRWRLVSPRMGQRLLDYLLAGCCLLTGHRWWPPSPSGQLVCRRCWLIQEPLEEG